MMTAKFQFRPWWIRRHVGRRVLILAVMICRPNGWRGRIGRSLLRLGFFVNGVPQ